MDKYDKAVRYLQKHPEDIGRAWADPQDYECGELYKYVNPSGKRDEIVYNTEGNPYGCLTQIRCDLDYVAFDDVLTEAIRNDERIPEDEQRINKDNLNLFANWQRAIDHYRETGELIVPE